MTRAVPAMWRCAVVLSLILLASGCANDGGDSRAQANEQVLAPSGAADGFVVTFSTEPAPPSKGDNQVVVTVNRPDGTPVTDGTVTTVFSMAAMPSMNMPAMRIEAALTHAGEGRYLGTSQLSMGGTWTVAVSVRQGGSELASRRTSVVAKE